jgi:hypothetical protein
MRDYEKISRINSKLSKGNPISFARIVSRRLRSSRGELKVSARLPIMKWPW